MEQWVLPHWAAPVHRVPQCVMTRAEDKDTYMNAREISSTQLTYTCPRSTPTQQISDAVSEERIQPGAVPRLSQCGVSSHDAASNPQPGGGPSVFMCLAQSGDRLAGLQGAGRARCCHRLQALRTCDMCRVSLHLLPECEPLECDRETPRRTLSRAVVRLKGLALAEVEARSEARLNGLASWLEKLAVALLQPATQTSTTRDSKSLEHCTSANEGHPSKLSNLNTVLLPFFSSLVSNVISLVFHWS